MSNDIPLKFYDIVDEYETEAAAPVKDEERDALARYFQLLIARLTNNEEIDEEAWPARRPLTKTALTISLIFLISGATNKAQRQPTGGIAFRRCCLGTKRLDSAVASLLSQTPLQRIKK
ncbi:hypothetical protein AZ026_000728 [Klebsiella pneumoniae]|nr:hypothetical protein AZ026_000728 [Klebsiella pneumoniae]